MQQASHVSRLLAAQNRELQNYWSLKDIFEYTRGVHDLPIELRDVLQLKMLTDNNPEMALGGAEVELLATKVQNRAQALLNLKNMAMIAKARPGFRGSPQAVLIESLAVRQFFSEAELNHAAAVQAGTPLGPDAEAVLSEAD